MLYAEAPEDGLQIGYFFNMMSPQARIVSAPYDSAELKLFREVCKSIKPSTYNLIVVAGGRQSYLSEAIRNFSSYTNIEPLTNLYTSDDILQLCEFSSFPIKNVAKKLQETTIQDLPSGPKVYFFIFNIGSYIPNLTKEINYRVNPGDMVIFSTWSTSPEATQMRSSYFEVLNKAEQGPTVDPSTQDHVLTSDKIDDNEFALPYNKIIMQEGVVEMTAFIFKEPHSD